MSPTKKMMDLASQAASEPNYTEKEKFIIANKLFKKEMEERQNDLEDLKLHKEKDKMVKEQRDKIVRLERENQLLKQKTESEIRFLKVSNNDDNKTFDDYRREYEDTDEYKTYCSVDDQNRAIFDLLEYDPDEY